MTVNDKTLYKLLDQGDAIYLIHYPKSNTWAPGLVIYADDSHIQDVVDQFAKRLGVTVSTADVTELLDEHFRGREREAEQTALLEIARKRGPQLFNSLARKDVR